MISCKKNFFLKFPEGQGLQQSSPNVVSCLCFDLGMTQVQVSGHKAAAAANKSRRQQLFEGSNLAKL